MIPFVNCKKFQHFIITFVLLTGSMQVIFCQIPDSTLPVSGAAICYGDTGVVGISGTEADVLYQIRESSTHDSVAPAQTGNNGDIFFSVSPSVTTSYYITASREDTLTSLLAEHATVFVDTFSIGINTQSLHRQLSATTDTLILTPGELISSLDYPCSVDSIYLKDSLFTCHHIGMNELVVYVRSSSGKIDSSSTYLELSYDYIPAWALQVHDTLCSGRQNNFLLGTSETAVNFTWSPKHAYPALSGVLSGFNDGGGSIFQYLHNDTSYYIHYYYEIEGTLPNGCVLLDTTLSVKIEPEPVIEVSTERDTICSGSTTAIQATPQGITLNAMLVHVSVSAPAEISGYQHDTSYQTPALIQDQLINSGTTPQTVVYTLTPQYDNTDMGTICSGNSLTLEILVEPDIAVQPILVADTFCNEENFLLSYTSIHDYTSNTPVSIQINGSAEHAGTLSGITASLMLTAGNAHSEIIHNISDSAQRVRYTANSFIDLPHGRCYGSQTSITDITIEPDLLLAYNRLQDTLCNHTTTNFSASQTTWASSSLYYNITAAPADANHLTGYSHLTDQSSADTLSQTLHNLDVQTQQIHYLYQPYLLDEHGLPRCSATAYDTLHVYVEPDIAPLLTPDTDTICSGTNSHISINTAAEPLREARFRYTFEAENGIHVLQQGDPFNLTPGKIISDQLTNTSDSVKKVDFYITAYSRETDTDTEHCTGSTDTATVWIEPVVSIQPHLAEDTLCNETPSHLYISTTSQYAHQYAYNVDVILPDTNSISGYTRDDALSLSDSTKHLLINHQASPATLRYALTSYSILADGTHCPGQSSEISLQVEPYPSIEALVSRDTLCHEETLKLAINQKSQTLGQLSYHLSIDDLSEISPLFSGYGTADSLSIFDTVSHSLLNLTAEKQWIQYRLHPFIAYSSGRKTCHYADQEDQSVYVEIMPQLQSTLSAKEFHGGWNISCFNGLDGQAEANLSGGAYEYPFYAHGQETKFSWSDGQTGQTAYGLRAGKYHVHIVDHFACTTSDSISLTQPTPITATTEVSEIDCSGGSDGAILLEPTGGTPGYSYQWEGPSGFAATSKDVSQLIKGSYFVTITDTNGCVYEYSGIGVDAPDPIQWGTTTSDYHGFHISCKGRDDGYVTPDVYGAGPSSLFEYAWEGPGGFTSSEKDIFALKAGSYRLSVTDTAACSNVFDIELTEPDSMGIILHSRNISCVDDSSGSIIAEPTGGSGGYSFQWSNNINELTASNKELPIGNYSVTVNDQNGCSTTDSARIREPQAIEIEINQASDFNGYAVSCHGDADGHVTVKLSNASDSVHYMWQDTTLFIPVRTGMQAGSYALMVRDNMGCTAKDSITLKQPEVMQLTGGGISTHCHTSIDGKAWVGASGGVGGYSYDWNGLGTDSVLENLAHGIYPVVVYDQNGCKEDTIIEVPCPEPIEIDYTLDASSCAQMPDGKIALRTSGGTAPYSLNINTNTYTFDSTLMLDDLLAKTYDLTIRDSMNCHYHLKFSLQSCLDHCIEIYTAFSPNNDGYNDYWTFDNLEYYPPARLEVYDRNGRLVYYHNQYANDWDGTFNGNPLPGGSYFYFLYLDGFDKPITGTMSIIR